MFEQILDKILVLNHTITRDELSARIEYNDDRTIRNFDLSGFEDRLVELPNNIKNLTFTNNLNLSNNQLRKLPEDFHLIKVFNLYLSNNNIESLPENFCNIKIGGDLNLSDNQLKNLPKSFCNIKVGGYLNLCYNLLRNLPKILVILQLEVIMKLLHYQEVF